MPPDDATAPPTTHPPPRRTSPLLLIVAWLVVGVPAAWGVSQTVMRSLALFTSPPPAAAPSAPEKSLPR